MSINDNMTKLRNGYIAGKSAFQSDQDRGEEFDATMKEVVDTVRSDAFVRFRAMMDSELDEAVRHVSEIRFEEGVAACEAQGTIQRPDNPYTKEAVAKAKQEMEEGGDDA